MKKLLAAAAVASMLASAGTTQMIDPVHASPGAGSPSCPAKAEDSRDWNWALCGNHARGAIDMWGNPRVVGVCEFRYLRKHRMLDYRSADRLVGDATAMAQPCRSYIYKGYHDR